MSSAPFLEEELTYNIRGAVYEVAKKYGSGLKEKVYECALAEEFEKRDLSFERQKRINLYSVDTKKILGVYVPDFVVERKVILEVKSIPTLTMREAAQQRSYLKVSEFEVALLVNFGASRVEIRRAIFTNDRKPFLSVESVSSSV